MRKNKYGTMELKTSPVKMFVWCIRNMFPSNKKPLFILPNVLESRSQVRIVFEVSREALCLQ
jgi:hypothetical protein